MLIPTDFSFSLIVPTRDRPDSLRRCIHSFLDRAVSPDRVEVLVMGDLDDHLPAADLAPRFPSLKFIYQPRSKKQNLHYQCYGGQCATAPLLWVLNDDVEMLTDRWDAILHEEIAKFPAGKLLYVEVDDDTHTDQHKRDTMGCCFPILSRSSAEIMGCTIPPEVDMWGGDKALWEVFLPARVLHLRDKIHLRHWCKHNKRVEPDATAKEVEAVSRKMDLSEDERDRYKRLLEAHV